MPRNSNGDYSLPAGNPVVPGEVISSAWANTTLNDLGSALTGSLSRSGEGAMLAGLELYDGTIGAPGLTWGTQTTAGFYRAAASDFRFAIAGIDVLTITAAGISAVGLTIDDTLISSTTPRLSFYETDAAADNRRWDLVVEGESFFARVVNDADSSATNWLGVTRTNNVVDLVSLVATAITLNGVNITDYARLSVGNTFTQDQRIQTTSGSYLLYKDSTPTVAAAFSLNNAAIGIGADAVGLVRYTPGTGWVVFLQYDGTDVNVPNGVLKYAGNEVGLRNPAVASKSSNFSLAQSDCGGFVGVGGSTTVVSVPILAARSTATLIIDLGAGGVTVQGTGGAAIFWMTGAGRVGPASRTVSDGSVVTLRTNDGTNWYIYGNGIS